MLIHCGGFNVTLPFAVENFRGVTRFESPMDAALAGLFYDFDTTTASKSRGPSMPPFRNAVFVHTGARDHKADALRFSRLAKAADGEAPFAQALALIEPSIKRVRLLEHAGR